MPVSVLGRLRRRPGPARPGLAHRHPIAVGVVFAVVVAAGFGVAFNKHRLLTDIRGGQTISAQFPRDYLLKPYLTSVKIAGVVVGTVTGVQPDAQGAVVSMKVFGDNAGKLGSAPTAQIRLTTLLGGNPYVQLYPGGAPGRPHDRIALARTSVPTYFDNIQDSITPDADNGIRRFIDKNDTALASGGTASLAQTFAEAPATLVPGGQVLQAMQGERAGDLEDLISATAQEDTVLTARLGQIESVVDGLGTFSATLGKESPALQATVAHLPADEAGTLVGLTALSSTLDDLKATAAVSRPTVQQLSQLLVQAQPTLVDAAPVLGRFGPFLADSTPLLDQLVPTATTTTKILDDVNGPTLAHLNGPTTTSANGRPIPGFLSQLTSVEHVELQRPATLYQEVGYVLAGLDSATSFYDQSGHEPEVILGNGPQNNYSAGVSTGSSTNGTYQLGTGCGAEACPASFTPVLQEPGGILPPGDGVTP
ncbi:MAG TPA: MlaD family protein [Acidimicrobiales bacterium]|nr:MlaD family protein [Acidimicrobiales bacterium]